MSIQSHLANARNLAAQKRYEEAIAEYEYVLDVDPENPEAQAGLDKLRGATSLAGSNFASQPRGGRITTDFFVHQAEEISAPVTKSAPVRIIMAVVIAAVLYGLFQVAMFFINYDKNTAMKNVEVRLQKPVVRNGEAFLTVDIYNYNPAPIRDTTFSYQIVSTTGAEIAGGKLTVDGVIPAGDSRTFAELKLGTVQGQPGRMRAELADVNYGPKPNLTAGQSMKFSEAAGMKDKDAVEAFKELVQVAPTFGPAYVGLGLALAANNEFDLAVKAYEKALKIDADDANAHYNLGVALFYKGDKEGARKQFEEAAKLEPTDPSPPRSLKALQSGSPPVPAAQPAAAPAESSEPADQ